jgi:PAS domain S-box-containing protein
MNINEFYKRMSESFFSQIAFTFSASIIVLTLLTAIGFSLFDHQFNFTNAILISLLYFIPILSIYFKKHSIAHWFFVLVPNLITMYYTFILNSSLPLYLFHLVFTLFPIFIFKYSLRTQQKEFKIAFIINILFFIISIVNSYQKQVLSIQLLIFFISLYAFLCLTVILIRKKIAFNEDALTKEILIKENIFNNLKEGIVIQEKNGSITYFNKASLDILKLTKDQILGKKSTDPDWGSIKEDMSPFPGEEHPAMLALKTGQPLLNVKMGLKTKKGINWIQINSIPIFEDQSTSQNSPNEVISTFSDITTTINDKKEKEYLLNRLDFAAKEIKFGVWEIDLVTGYIEWNDAQYEVFGRTKNEFKNNYQSFESFLVAEDRERIQKQFYACIQKQNKFDTEFRVTTNTGDYKLIKAIAQAYYDQNNNPIKVIGLNWDISDLRTKELKIIQNAKMATLGEMSSNIAHEINNPLTIIIGQLQLLDLEFKSDKIDFEKIKQISKSIENTTLRIAKIIKGLKTFSRNAENDPFEQITFKQIIEETLSFCEQRFKNQQIQIKILPYDPHIILECRPTQISQVLINLLQNSFDAIANLKEKWIHIEIMQNQHMTKIKITDSGQGIPPELQNKIMQPFFTSKPKEVGTGLGLPICKEIIENHQGKFYYDPNCSNTTFVIELPTQLSP